MSRSVNRIFLIFLILVIISYQVSSRTIIGDDITTDGSINIGENTSISSKYLNSSLIYAQSGFKDFNKTIWKMKINYAYEVANTTLVEQEKLALIKINNSKNESIKNNHESLETRRNRIIGTGNEALTLISLNEAIARSKLQEARNLAQLNGATILDYIEINIEANNKSLILNQAAISKAKIINDNLNNSLLEINNNYNNTYRNKFNFTTNILSSNSNLIYSDIVSLPVIQGKKTIINCEILTNSSVVTTGVYYWSNVTNSSNVYQFIEYYFDDKSSSKSQISTLSNTNFIDTTSGGSTIRITKIKIYSDQILDGSFSLKFKTEINGSKVSIFPPSTCEKKEY